MISRIKPGNIRAIGRFLILTTIAAMLTIPGIPIAQIPASAFVASNIDRSGYEMRVRFDRRLSSMSSRVGDEFTATVADPGPFNLARISGRVESITQSQLFKGATEMHLSFERIRFRDRMGYPITAEIIRLYDVPSGEQVDVEVPIETGRKRRPQTLKRTKIGALASGVFGGTSGAGGGACNRPRVVGAGSTAACGHKELILDQGVEMLLRVYPN
jgi:hypothetical protein